MLYLRHFPNFVVRQIEGLEPVEVEEGFDLLATHAIARSIQYY